MIYMGIERHQANYKEGSWKLYTFVELGNWVHNLVKRAGNRKGLNKIAKDLHDAKNYLWMMEEKLKSEAAEYGIDWEEI